MFDDPRKELKRLQDELLAAEEEDAVEDDLSDIADLLEEYTAEDEDYEACFEENYEDEYDQPQYRNYANGYGAKVRNYANGYGQGTARSAPRSVPEEQPLDEDSVLYRDDYLESRKKPKEKGVRGLVILACLETLGILAVLVRWILWLI